MAIPWIFLHPSVDYIYTSTTHMDLRPHPCRMRSQVHGFSPGLKNMPPACFLPHLRWGRPLRIPNPMRKNTQPRMWLGVFWQRMRDSNPRKRSQSPVCYRYTNPLFGERVYYTQLFPNVKLFCDLVGRNFSVLQCGTIQPIKQGAIRLSV